ncbi:ATP-dependent Clp protease proteolytic subunit [Chitinimonas lacunae]|uniref:ATP-dependent Clp protease proteolytic subunit n=1 Tax=Chitinimonas lacunae TaxID=1963018 RepID=A0ABV8MMF0_9NEIS
MTEAKDEVKKPRVKRPPVLFPKTQQLIGELEARLGHRLLAYWTSNNGSVCANDLVALHNLFQKIGTQNEISLFIKSRGGDPESALRIVHLMRQYCGRINVLVPLECASAATMIALGADVIRMGPLSYLTAVDSSLTHDLSPLDRDNDRVSVSADELARIIRLWRLSGQEHHATNPYSEIFRYIHPLVVGAIDRSSSLSIRICAEILRYHMTDDARATAISQHMNSDYPSHSYPITRREAARIGLNVEGLDDETNNMLLVLNEFYSEMGQRAVTDFDECNQHDNSILNIIEARDTQIFYQNERDWVYLREERRWRTLNDESTWRKTEVVDGKRRTSRLHIR